MVDPVVKVEDVWVSYGACDALGGVTFEVLPGEVHALIGPNGAGKSSLGHVITGVAKPVRGKVVLEGVDITRLGPRKRARLGVGSASQQPSLFAELTAFENLAAAREARSPWRLFGPMSEATEMATYHMLHVIGLTGRAQVAAGALRPVEQRLLEIGMSLLARPSVLVLDETIAGAGPDDPRALLGLLRSLKGSCAILLIEHSLQTVYDLADHVTVMAGGRILTSANPDEIDISSEWRAAYLGEVRENA